MRQEVGWNSSVVGAMEVGGGRRPMEKAGGKGICPSTGACWGGMMEEPGEEEMAQGRGASGGHRRRVIPKVWRWGKVPAAETCAPLNNAHMAHTQHNTGCRNHKRVVMDDSIDKYVTKMLGGGGRNTMKGEALSAGTS